MNIQVIGAGSWGLALAGHLAGAGHDVRLWCRENDGPDRLRETRLSESYLPGFRLPEAVQVSRSVLHAPELALLAVPSHAMRAVLEEIPFAPDTIRISVAKGIENGTLLRMSEVIHAVHGDEVAAVALSGPTHAEEVAQGLPASLVAAGPADAAGRVQAAFNTPALRVYTSTDLPGVEIGGSLKNVIAIAAGACDGLGLGDNAKAALITRGLAEMARLGVACGGDPLTFAGLSGMGDLIVTCTSRHSRNRAVGEALAAGKTLDQILAYSTMVAEGVKTTASAHALAQRENVDMPITAQVHRVLFENANPREAVTELMTRDPKPERH